MHRCKYKISICIKEEFLMKFFSRFEVASDTDLETSISGDDINAVHAELLQRINQAVGVEVVNTRGRGADFFGISHPTVMNLLQSSPGIKKCVNYKMTKFEVIYSLTFFLRHLVKNCKQSVLVFYVMLCPIFSFFIFQINKSGEPYIEENDASLRFESLQRSINFTRSHMEEMDQQETLNSTTTLRDLLGNS